MIKTKLRCHFCGKKLTAKQTKNNDTVCNECFSMEKVASIKLEKAITDPFAEMRKKVIKKMGKKESICFAFNTRYWICDKLRQNGKDIYFFRIDKYAESFDPLKISTKKKTAIIYLND